MSSPYFYTWSKQNNIKDLELDSSDGAYFKKGDSKILDFTSISFHANWGHGHFAIIQKIINQLNQFAVTSAKSKYPLKDQVTNDLIKLIGRAGKIFYTVSGAEANENAIKILREVTGKKRVVACQKSYHGATLGALSLTGDWRRENHLLPDEFVTHIPSALDDPDFSRSEQILDKLDQGDFAGLVWETVSGVNGVVKPGTLWWQNMNKWRQKTGAKLLLDEVLCGFFRCGAAMAFHTIDEANPDFVMMSKGITGGHVPFGAVWVSSDLASYYDDKVLSCGLTNYAHPLGIAACSAIFDLMNDQKNIDQIKKLEGLFENGVMKLATDFGAVTNRVEGLLGIIEFADPLSVNANDFLEQGLYVIVKEKSIIMSPAFILDKEDMDLGFEIINRVLKG